MIVNRDVLERFKARSQVIATLREALSNRGYYEVETPILLPGDPGSGAHPFTTHHRAFDKTLFLRGTCELYLKMALIGGFDRVYEIGKVFRNEGSDANHLQEFSLLEFYSAYASIDEVLALCATLVDTALMKYKGQRILASEQGALDFSKGWKCFDISEEVHRYTGFSYRDIVNRAPGYEAHISRMHELLPDVESPAEALMILFKREVEQTLVGPALVYGFPVASNPLTLENRADPGFLERYYMYLHGQAIADIAAENVDGQVQRDRFDMQSRTRPTNAESLKVMQNKFVRALEMGAPPMVGAGMSVDRLVAVLTGTRYLQDVVMFPLRRES
jgi:lysyl-tRNA synthetase class 2